MWFHSLGLLERGKSREAEVRAVTLVLLTMVSAGNLWSSPRNWYHAVTAGVSALKASHPCAQP